MRAVGVDIVVVKRTVADSPRDIENTVGRASHAGSRRIVNETVRYGCCDDSANSVRVGVEAHHAYETSEGRHDGSVHAVREGHQDAGSDAVRGLQSKASSTAGASGDGRVGNAVGRSGSHTGG